MKSRCGFAALTCVVAVWNSGSDAAVPDAASAADAPDTRSEGIEQVVVTAQKREQKLSDVGISIDTLSAEQLRSSGITDVKDLAQVTSGLNVGTNYIGGYVFSLRGINFNASQFSAAPAVSTYVDEAILPYSQMTQGLLLDVERVEVLKGPQGTLFGQNATGGSINVISAKPTAQLALGAHSEVDNFGRLMIEGYASGPLTDTLRARLSAQSMQFGAWQRGYYLNSRKNGDQNRGAARLLLEWTPLSDITVSLNLNGNYDHGEQIQPQLALAAPVNPAATVPGFINYPLPRHDRDADIDDGFNTHADNRLYQAVLRADYQAADSLTLTSLSNYVNYKSSYPWNTDAVALKILRTQMVGNDATFSQELRATGHALDSRLVYIVGANYQHDEVLDYESHDFEGYSTIPPGANLIVNYRPTNRATGAFANLDYQLVPKLTLTGGLRYTETKEAISGCTFGNDVAAGLVGFVANVYRSIANLPPTTAYSPGGCLTINDLPGVPGGAPDYLPIVANVDQKEHNISWRGGVNFKPTADDLIYGLISRGYKAGVYPVQISLVYSEAPPVKQEELTAYEIGTKLAFPEQRAQVNLAVFYYDYANRQFYTYKPLPVVGAGALFENVPHSHLSGVDTDILLAPIEGLTVRAALTYLDSKVGAFHTYSPAAQPVDVTGSQFNFAPHVSSTAAVEYKLPVRANLDLVLGSNVLYNTQTYASLGENPEVRIPSYAVIDAQVGLASHSGWRVGAFIRNIADRYYWNSVYLSGDDLIKSAGLPRTYGLSFDVSM